MNLISSRFLAPSRANVLRNRAIEEYKTHADDQIVVSHRKLLVESNHTSLITNNNNNYSTRKSLIIIIISFVNPIGNISTLHLSFPFMSWMVEKRLLVSKNIKSHACHVLCFYCQLQ